MPDREWDSRVCNISTSGCMIACGDGELPERAALRIRVRGLAAIDAEVVWQHRNRAGVRFRVPLHPAAMDHLGFELPDGAWASAFAASPQDRRPRQPAGRVAPTLSGGLIKRLPHAAELGN